MSNIDSFKIVSECVLNEGVGLGVAMGSAIVLPAAAAVGVHHMTKDRRMRNKARRLAKKKQRQNESLEESKMGTALGVAGLAATALGATHYGKQAYNNKKNNAKLATNVPSGVVNQRKRPDGSIIWTGQLKTIHKRLIDNANYRKSRNDPRGYAWWMRQATIVDRMTGPKERVINIVIPTANI